MSYSSDTQVLPPPPPPPPQEPLRPAASAPPSPPGESGRTGRGDGWRSSIVSGVVAALVAVLVAVPVAQGQVDDVAGTATTESPSDGSGDASADASVVDAEPIAAVAEALSPSIAHVSVSGAGGQGAGSAVVYREDGYLLTNAHVVANGSDIEVVLPDGQGYEAEVVGADTVSDLAVLRIDATDLPVPELADTPPAVGDMAVALGSPFGLEGSVTAGIVSAMDRSIPGSGSPLVGLLQTDAPINPGNSGGALGNSSGELIGINTAILSQSRENNGIGFAIPIGTIVPLADQLISQGRVDHAQLGIEGQSVDPQVAELYALGVDQGAIVANVLEGGPADEAGLERGDIVISVDGDDVGSMAELAGRVRSYQPGDQVELTIVRDGSEQTVEVTLGESETTG